MYSFHYDFIVAKYGSRVRLCMTDTDSLLYDIRTDNVYDDIKENLHLFDTSEYPTTDPCYSVVTKKRLATFKDERHSKLLVEFVGVAREIEFAAGVAGRRV